MKTGAQLMAEAKARITEVTPEQVLEMQQRGEPVTLLDVRDLHEVNAAKIPGTLHISRGNLETKIEAQVPREAHVIIYCATGNRSVFAADRLREMGYSNVASMSGGIRDWIAAGGEIE
ncbi:MAG TPA: rhodanese-like domain-containing protein [Gemmatimonadaceae bacterium]|jgi:rhodanese-related sulfurtransferase|nr:rhodanese-like domain-containing protein [Gemmatimonadaceae bacterium]